MSEPYEGDLMFQCLLKPFDFKNTSVVVVSGISVNPCGHALLNTVGGWYFHVAGFVAPPRFMRENGYKQYLKENGKHEIRRSAIKIPDPAGSHRKLEELLAKQWA